MEQTYEAFLAECQDRQRAYIKDEQERMDQAAAIRTEFEKAMRLIGLHPLTRDEITDRQRELTRMKSAVPETHGDNPVMRWSYERTPNHDPR